MQRNSFLALTTLLISVAVTGCPLGKQPGSGAGSDQRAQVTSSAQNPLSNSLAEARGLQDGDWFESATYEWEIDFSYSNGDDAGRNTILETVGGGIGLLDYDLDGCLDLICVGGGSLDCRTGMPTGRQCGVFRNYDTEALRDVTKAATFESGLGYSHGCVCGDLNSDGFDDVIITCFGTNILFVNQGDGTFRDSTPEQGFGSGRWNTAAALGDVNQDGEVDIYITGYVDWVPSEKLNVDVPGPQQYNAIGDQLLLNLADGHFADISSQAGIRTDGMGLGVLATDLNQDRKVDFYVANDVVANHLYLGDELERLREVGEPAGVAFNEFGAAEGSMGVDCADIDGDGHEDLWVTNFEMEDGSLYLNLGGRFFQHSTTAFHLAGMGRRHVGFGTGLRDFDNDGWPDLFVVNGHVRYHEGVEPFMQVPLLCRNVQGKSFVEVKDEGGMWFRHPHAARGAATGDFDNDGDLDLIVSNLQEPVSLLRNRQQADNWVQFKPIGVRSSRSPVGCLLSIEAFGRRVVQSLTSGSGYLSHSEAAILFALEADRNAVDVTVAWPSGADESFGPLTTRAKYVLVEGRGQPLNQPRK